MSARRIAGASALTLAATLLPVAVVHADTPSETTLYVQSGSSSNCSDSGTGTITQPYCTIQPALDAVSPGQSVYIEPGSYAGPIAVTRSGTATAPITITAPTPSAGGAYSTSVQGTNAATPVIAITNVQYVNMSNISVPTSVGDNIQVSGSSNVTLDRMQTDESAPAGSTRLATSAGFHVTGASSSVTVQRSEARGGIGPGIEIDGGSTGTVVSTNRVGPPSGSNSIGVDDAPHTTITSNTTSTVCAQSLVVGDGSNDAIIENNVLLDGCAKPGSNTMTLDAAAASSAVADYNVLGNNANGARYSWGGITYATAAAFAAAVGQGAHDIDSTLLGSIAAVDSANSDAPGELSTDLSGRARIDDPVVANTGVGAYAYYDRGASETQEPLAVTLSASATDVHSGSNVTFTAAPLDAWASSFSYAFDFGDGTKTTDATGVETHTYTAAGTYWPTVTVTSPLGASVLAGAPIIDVQAPPVPVFTGGFLDALTFVVNWPGNTSAGWSPASATIDFGDCSTPFTTSAPSFQNVIHAYAAPGIYTVTMTIKYADANTATASKTYPAPYYTGINTWCSPTRILKTPGSATAANPTTALSTRTGALLSPDFQGLGSPLPAGTAAIAPAASGANHPAGNAATPATTTAGGNTNGARYDSEEMAYLAQLIIEAVKHFAQW